MSNFYSDNPDLQATLRRLQVRIVAVEVAHAFVL